VIFFSSNYAGVVAYIVESSQELLITTKVDLLAHILLIRINFVLHIVCMLSYLLVYYSPSSFKSLRFCETTLNYALLYPVLRAGDGLNQPCTGYIILQFFCVYPLFVQSSTSGL
jgi:hypothetical protein